MSIDAMKQALDALEEINKLSIGENAIALPAEIDTAMDALRERLAQPEMQPCAGRNCGSTNPNLHSAECFEDYEKSTGMAQPKHDDPIGDAQNKLIAEQAQEPIAWVYQEGLEALKSGRPWTAYGSNGDGRIPLYLNDAVAPRAEPRESGSGAGFESLPASPKWQGLTDEERGQVINANFGTGLWQMAKDIEAKLKEKNT